VRHSARQGRAAAAREPASTAWGRTAGAAGRGPGRARFAQVPYWLVVCGAGLGLLWMVVGGERDVRGGTLVIAGVLLAAAAARLGLPERRAGMLQSRRRAVDVAAFAALGIGLLVAGLIFPAPR
jgi:hypothetical protein